jgi:hypothetical protein
MVKYVRAEPARYNISEERLRTFEALCLSLERKVFSAAIFEGLIGQDYGFETSKVSLFNSTTFSITAHD